MYETEEGLYIIGNHDNLVRCQTVMLFKITVYITRKTCGKKVFFFFRENQDMGTYISRPGN